MGRLRTFRWLLLPAALGLAGCGSLQYPAMAGSEPFSIRASAASVATNGEVELRAYLPSGGAAPVAWRIVSGTNAGTLGQGHVGATGNYTAPGSLSSDSITVRVEAALTDSPQTS